MAKGFCPDLSLKVWSSQAPSALDKADGWSPYQDGGFDTWMGWFLGGGGRGAWCGPERAWGLETPLFSFKPQPCNSHSNLRKSLQASLLLSFLIWKVGPVKARLAELPEGRRRECVLYAWHVGSLFPNRQRGSRTGHFRTAQSPCPVAEGRAEATIRTSQTWVPTCPHGPFRPFAVGAEGHEACDNNIITASVY